MSHNLRETSAAYERISTLDQISFDNKSVLLIGAGLMAKQYATALSTMGTKEVTIVSTSTSSTKLAAPYNYKASSGGFGKGDRSKLYY